MRFAILVVCIVNHQKILGWLEVRTRMNAIAPGSGHNQVVLDFKTVKYRHCDFPIENRKEAKQDLKENLIQKQTEDLDKSEHLSGNHTCSICCLDFKENETLTCLPCNMSKRTSVTADSRSKHFNEYMHTFHPKCIRDWLMRSDNCPLCKMDVIKI